MNGLTDLMLTVITNPSIVIATMKILLTVVIWNLVARCFCLFTENNKMTSLDVESHLENAGYPKIGDIPTLNRKIFKGHRVTIREHPYVVSIRRHLAHYLVGTLLTKNVVITVANPVLNVPITELGVVLGETYSDRGTVVNTVVLVVIHQDFDPYTLKADIAMLRFYEDINYRFTVKAISLVSFKAQLDGSTAFVTGWGRCDNTGTELCLYRSSIYYPDEKVDPILQSVSFPISQSNYYCDGYKRREVSILEGMLCIGPARQHNAVCPCMAIPGAPLVVQSRLAGFLSWGFGCGYQHDLPLIYTSIKSYTSWILHNIVKMGKIKQANLTQLFRATKAYLIAEWFMHTRVKTPTLKIKRDKCLEPLDIDKELSGLQGRIYDVRDYINGGSYHREKQNIYADIINAEQNMEKIMKIKKSRVQVPVYAFMSNKSADIEFKWVPFIDENKYAKKQILSEKENDDNDPDIIE